MQTLVFNKNSVFIRINRVTLDVVNLRSRSSRLTNNAFRLSNGSAVSETSNLRLLFSSHWQSRGSTLAASLRPYSAQLVYTVSLHPVSVLAHLSPYSRGLFSLFAQVISTCHKTQLVYERTRQTRPKFQPSLGPLSHFCCSPPSFCLSLRFDLTRHALVGVPHRPHKPWHLI